jgi:molecular chaperone GrpE
VTGTAKNSAGAGKPSPAEDSEVQPTLVIRDKRKIRRDGPGTPADPAPGSQQAADAPPAGPVPPEPDEPDQPGAGTATEDEVVVVGEVVDPDGTAGDLAGDGTADTAATGPDVVARDSVDETVIEPETEGDVVTGVLGAELAALRAELDERTGDLLRVTAEYANYRKRVDRDRSLAGEQAVGAVLAALLPILDDLDRAREHGDLVGPFGTVAEQLSAAVGKFGLTPFGEKGDPFDPTRHEAVAHQTSAEVTEPTCVDIMRRGYLLGERLLRPALVAVADPE